MVTVLVLVLVRWWRDHAAPAPRLIAEFLLTPKLLLCSSIDLAPILLVVVSQAVESTDILVINLERLIPIALYIDWLVPKIPFPCGWILLLVLSVFNLLSLE